MKPICPGICDWCNEEIASIEDHRLLAVLRPSQQAKENPMCEQPYEVDRSWAMMLCQNCVEALDKLLRRSHAPVGGYLYPDCVRKFVDENLDFMDLAESSDSEKEADNGPFEETAA